MKNSLKILMVVLFNITLISAQQSNKVQYKIGDFAEGGIVFYVDESGEHGLVCAINDQSLGSRWNHKRLPTKHGLLSSKNNSNKSIFKTKYKKYHKNSDMHAKRVCSKLKIKEGNKTYKDWYLPSKKELNMMFINKSIINKTSIANGGNSFMDNYYWSSSEFNDKSAWAQNFFNGELIEYSKDYNCKVRAIRSF